MSTDVFDEEKARAVEDEITAEQQKYYEANGGKGDVRDFLQRGASEDGWQRFNGLQQGLWRLIKYSSQETPL